MIMMCLSFKFMRHGIRVPARGTADTGIQVGFQAKFKFFFKLPVIIDLRLPARAEPESFKLVITSTAVQTDISPGEARAALYDHGGFVAIMIMILSLRILT